MRLTCLGRCTLLFILPVFTYFAQARPSKSSETDAATKLKVESEFSQLPMSFELNQGQTDPQVKAMARGNGYGLFLTSTESVFVLAPGQSKRAVLRWKLVGSNPTPNVQPLDRLPGMVNVFIGNDPSRWQREVPVYGKMKYDRVYPGVDLIYYGTQQQLEYDFIVAPGANPRAIRFDISGADKVLIDRNGDLVLKTHHGEVRHHKPVIYQEIDGVRHAVDGRFVLAGKHGVGFEVAAYDRERNLVIDPSMAFATYVGGSGSDLAKCVGTDKTGDTYIGGTTASADFPLAGAAPYQTYGGGGSDAFFTVLLFQSGGGNRPFISTYFGGNGSDSMTAMVVLQAGVSPDIYVAGSTTSTNLPTVSPLQTSLGGGQDAFVAHLKFPSSIAFASYLGGSGNDAANGIAVDNLGNMIVVGGTNSTDFPTMSALQPANAGGADAFVTKIDHSLTGYDFSTYLGTSGTDSANSVAVDNVGLAATNKIYVAGLTTSSTFASHRVGKANIPMGAHAFLALLSSDGSQKLASEQFGGSGTTSALGVATAYVGSVLNSVYVAGLTTSGDFPTVNPIQANLGGKSDAFLTKFDPAVTTMQFSTYFGGSGADQASGVATDLGGNAFIAGVTTSTDFPTKSAVQAASAGGADGFVAQILANGTVGYSTYLGGSGTDFITAIAVGAAGNAVVAGYTNSTNFPVSSSGAAPWQPNLKGGYDAFAAKINTK